MSDDLAARVATLEMQYRDLSARLSAGGGPDARLTIKQAAPIIGRKPRTIRWWLADARMRRRMRVTKYLTQIGGRWLCTRVQAEEWARFLGGVSRRGNGR